MKTEYEKVLLPGSVQQELEKLRTQAVADAAEIARLQSGFDELKKMAFNLKTDVLRENHVEYDKGWKDCATSFYQELNRITGVEK